MGRGLRGRTSPHGGPLTGNSERLLYESLETGHLALGMGFLSLTRLRGGGLGGGGLLHWRPGKICSDSIRIWAS